jgi:hypothetical protein
MTLETLKRRWRLPHSLQLLLFVFGGITGGVAVAQSSVLVFAIAGLCMTGVFVLGLSGSLIFLFAPEEGPIFAKTPLAPSAPPATLPLFPSLSPPKEGPIPTRIARPEDLPLPSKPGPIPKRLLKKTEKENCDLCGTTIPHVHAEEKKA